jgi:hypothetical protein
MQTSTGSWHTYSGFDSKYFTKVREVRSLVNQHHATVKVDCQLVLTCRCRVQDSDAAVLILRLTTSNTGRDNVKLKATTKLVFGHEEPAGQDTGNVAGDSAAANIAGNSTLKLTSCQPAAVKGLPQGRRETVQTNIEPAVSTGGIFDLSLGSYARGREEDMSTSWSFNTFCQSENEPSGYYNSVLLQLDATDRRSLESFANRPITAATVLENVGSLVIAQSKVELRTSAWLPRLRCWGKNKISRGEEAGSKRSTQRKIALGAISTEPIEKFDQLESLLKSYVELANEQSLPLGESLVARMLASSWLIPNRNGGQVHICLEAVAGNRRDHGRIRQTR